MYISGYFCDELCAVVGDPSTPALSHLILMNVISNSDSSCRLIQHEYRVVFLMWACEVIMVCDKIWVVDCGVCCLIDQISLLGIPMYTLVFTLHVYRYYLVMPYQCYTHPKRIFSYSHINPATVSTRCECMVLRRYGTCMATTIIC